MTAAVVSCMQMNARHFWYYNSVLSKIHFLAYTAGFAVLAVSRILAAIHHGFPIFGDNGFWLEMAGIILIPAYILSFIVLLLDIRKGMIVYGALVLCDMVLHTVLVFSGMGLSPWGKVFTFCKIGYVLYVAISFRYVWNMAVRRKLR